MKNWAYTIALLVGYVGLFELWLRLGREGVIVSGIVWAVLFGLLAGIAHSRRYFHNGVELGLHAVVILDVVLEALLIEEHSHSGFWWCGGGFALVLGGYRWYLRSNLSRPLGR